jgi:hypothetical protein
MLHAVDGSFKALNALGHGQKASTSVPEAVRVRQPQLDSTADLGRTQWHAGRAFGQTGKCSQPDGNGCTLLECDFSNPGFRQCNLSRVSGFNIPMGFQFNGAGCGGDRWCARFLSTPAATLANTRGQRRRQLRWRRSVLDHEQRRGQPPPVQRRERAHDVRRILRVDTSDIDCLYSVTFC